MARTATRITPANLVDFYIGLGDDPEHIGKAKPIRDALWKKWGTKTAKVMADGTRTLIEIWEAAWINGGGGAIANNRLRAIPYSRLMALYRDNTFVPSYTLNQIAAHLH